MYLAQPTLRAALIRRLTTTISVMTKTLVTAASRARAARMMFPLSLAAVSPSLFTGMSVKLLIIEAASLASRQASLMSAANSGFSLAISSPTFTKCKIASRNFLHISCSVFRACVDLLSLAFL